LTVRILIEKPNKPFANLFGYKAFNISTEY